MRRCRRIAVLLLGNLLVLLAIIVTLNLLASIMLDLERPLMRTFKGNSRARLPNYSDHERADRIYDEIRSLDANYVPHVVWRREPFRGEFITINAEGERVHAATTSDPVGTVRFLGGSTTWGAGVDDEGTIPAKFNALYPDFQVHNHGEAGYQSRQELALLVNLVNSGEPMDLVIFYDGANERTFCRDEVPLNGSTRTAMIRRRVKPPSFAFEALAGGILEIPQSDFFARFVYRTEKRPNRCEVDAGHPARVAAWTLANWKMARRAAELAGAQFLAILQPVAQVGSPRLDYMPQGDYVKRDIPPLYEALRAEIAREGADWILDFTDAFDGDEIIYLDYCHASENGNAIIAQRIARVVDPLLQRIREDRAAAHARGRDRS